MVLVPLKHVHVVRPKLASGRRAEYHYAWKGKGAPRLPGQPGSDEYVAAYQAAHAVRKQPTTGTMYELITAFRASPEFAKLKPATKRAYLTYLDLIEARWRNLPIAALNEVGVRRHFIAWRNEMATTPRKADYAVGTLKRLLAWSVAEVRIQHNHAAPIGRLHSADRSDSIWTDEEMDRLGAHASPELMWAVRLASFTGLRQGDLIRLTWTNYDGASFALRTSKRGKSVLIPATAGCRALVKEIAKRQATILTTSRGHRPWTADGLRSSFGKACAEAQIDRTFHDLRRTAATRLVAEGHPSSAVAMMMGWEEEAVESLKRKYVSRAAVVESMLARVAEND